MVIIKLKLFNYCKGPPVLRLDGFCWTQIMESLWHSVHADNSHLLMIILCDLTCRESNESCIHFPSYLSTSYFLVYDKKNKNRVSESSRCSLIKDWGLPTRDNFIWVLHTSLAFSCSSSLHLALQEHVTYTIFNSCSQGNTAKRPLFFCHIIVLFHSLFYTTVHAQEYESFEMVTHICFS